MCFDGLFKSVLDIIYHCNGSGCGLLVAMKRALLLGRSQQQKRAEHHPACRRDGAPPPFKAACVIRSQSMFELAFLAKPAVQSPFCLSSTAKLAT